MRPCRAHKRLMLTPQREHQAALEGRIHQLEAQLAAHVNAPMHGMETIDENMVATTPSSFDWGQTSSPLTVDTNFAPFSPEAEIDLGNFSAGSVPSIAISQCELPASQPQTSSPAPSSWSGTTQASSPERLPTNALHFPNLAYSAPGKNLTYPPASRPFSRSPAPHTAPSWEFMAVAHAGQLKPEASQSTNLSRRTSLSSSLESEEPGTDGDADVQPLAPAPRLPRQGIFAAHIESPPPGSSRSSFTDKSRAINTTPFPSRFEAETLTSEFVQHLESIDRKVYAVSPGLFSRFCESVYPDPKNRTISVEAPVSTSMARFHVFMAMAIGMKMRIKNSPENSNSLLDTCYDLAMQQTTSPAFWQENGGVEASQLLNIFSSIRKELILAPRPLQSAFSW